MQPPTCRCSYRKRGRSANTLREQQEDGKWVNRESKQKEGFRLDEVRAIPLRSSDVDALASLRRILWRLEHVALLQEMPLDLGAPANADANATKDANSANADANATKD